ncbi:MAG: M12 family metallo-peptidase [Planctomycetota bacterium]
MPTLIAVNLIVLTSALAGDANPTATINAREIHQAGEGHVVEIQIPPAVNDSTRKVTITDVPLGNSRKIDLQLRPITIAPARMNVVRGRRGQPDVAIPAAQRRLSLFGVADGAPGSSVWLYVTDNRIIGSISLGEPNQNYRLSDRDLHGNRLPANQVTIFQATNHDHDAPPCGLSTTDHAPVVSQGDQPLATAGQLGEGPLLPLRHRFIEIAVETDYELYSIFNNEQEVIDYIIALFTEVSGVYLRDAGATYQVVFIRVWDTPEDLFNETNPLGPFVTYWQQNMQDVSRDLATFCTGRRDLPYGGVAFLSAACGPNGYSVNGYLTGDFPAPNVPASGHYGSRVVAHELGHNFGSPHTPDYNPPIDLCFPPPTVPQRGTLMSYCSQTVSGGRHANDIRFHSRVTEVIRDQIESASCLTDDCNYNGIDDADDILQATSDDDDGNGVPDECEDCNNNGTNDNTEVFLGLAPDVNGNDVPDECEPDCNGNTIPDTHDIAVGNSIDAYGNNIPDECEEDCDDNGTSDYSDIQADLTLDVNRNTRLDTCEDCDGDGQTDFDELSSAHNVWMASSAADTLGEFHAQTGVRAATSESIPGGAPANDVLITDDGRILASIPGQNAIVEYDRTGNAIGTLVAPGTGGLTGPTFMAISPDDTLVVSSAGSDSVLEFNVVTGSFVRELVAAGSGGLDNPTGLTYGYDGHLYVASATTHEVLKYGADTGDFVDVFVSATDNGGIEFPAGMSFAPSGQLLVAGFNSDSINAYDGATGAALGPFNYGGSIVGPWGLRIGPNGNVFVTRNYQLVTTAAAGPPVDEEDGPQPLHVTTTRMYEFDFRNGYVLGSFMVGDDSNLELPAGFDFYPGWNADCNVNYRPDNCDILEGFSSDNNEDGTPDECQIDCNSNGTYDRFDIIPYGQSFDCNGNRVPDECDILNGLVGDCNANQIPDDCETECNGNGIPDECDIDSGTSADCNSNLIPDECEPDCNQNDQPDECDVQNGDSNDCNASGAPDECEFNGVFEDTSTELGPIGVDNPIQYVIPDGPTPISDVTISIEALADFGNSSEWIDLFLNGAYIGTLFADNGIDCPSTSGPDIIVVSLDQYLAARATGAVTLMIIATDAVSPTLCSGSSQLTVTVQHQFDADCDGNGILDACEPSGGDCNGNGVADACDISAGVALDCNTNAIPDACDLESGKATDNNGNGVPDACDAQAPLAEDSIGQPCAADGDCPTTSTCINGVCYAPKNRYLTIEANPDNDGLVTARRIGVMAGDPGEEVVIGWIGQPGPNGVSNVTSAPFYAAWDQLDQDLEVLDCSITPGRTYVIRAVRDDQDPADESNLSDPLTLKTTGIWADMVGDFVDGQWQPADGNMNFVDILAQVQGFQSLKTAAPVSWLDLENFFPNNIVNFADLLLAVQAFQQEPYPYLDPCTCQALSPCP